MAFIKLKKYKSDKSVIVNSDHITKMEPASLFGSFLNVIGCSYVLYIVETPSQILNLIQNSELEIGEEECL